MFFRYVIGSLLARPIHSTVSIFSIALVICASALALAFYDGLRANLAKTGRSDNVVVMSSSVLQMSKSQLARDAFNSLKVLQDVAVVNGEPLVSPEALIELPLDNAGSKIVGARGVEPIAFAVHDQVQIIEGHAPTPGTNELMIGRKLLGKTEGVVLGGSVEVGDAQWPIVGVFAAGGTALEHEVWGDRSRLSQALKRANVLAAVIRVSNEQQVEPVIAQLKASHPASGAIFAMRELEYYETTIGDVSLIASAVAAILAILILGAVISAANTLHASISGRIDEFAVLWVVGNKRRTLVALVVQESLVVCLAAAALAIGAVAACAGVNVKDVLGAGLEFPLPFGTRQLIEGLALGLGIALLGVLFPSFQLLRRDLAGDLT